MQIKSYSRGDAVEYALKWANGRNSTYYNFDSIGGDCTNFASQCIFAGAKIMNYTPDTGWYYRNINDRAPAWTGVEYLYRFLVNNNSVGPFARVVGQNEAETGDLIQLGNRDGSFYHSLIITQAEPYILVAAHTYDAINRPLFSYTYANVRFLHIEAVRIW